MIKTKIVVCFLILGVLLFTADSFAGRGIATSLGDSYPALDLLYPVSENIDLAGKTTLQFRWRQVDEARTDHYEFKLYKGYQMLGPALILKQDISRDNCPFELPAENFEINQVYTWFVRQVYLDGSKNDWAHSSFKITKK